MSPNYSVMTPTISTLPCSQSAAPGEKINHGLLIIGEQGIGKDTMLEPIKHIVGPWNFSEYGNTCLVVLTAL